MSIHFEGSEVIDLAAGPDGACDDSCTAWLAQIYADHARNVYAVAAHLGGSAAAASVTEEVFLQYATRNGRQNGEPRRAVRAELLRMTCQKSAGAARSRSALATARAVSVSRQALDGDGQRKKGTAPSTSYAAVLHMLPSHLADPIAVVFLGSCTYREAASVLGISADVVQSRLLEGLMLVKEHLHTSESGRAHVTDDSRGPSKR